MSSFEKVNNLSNVNNFFTKKRIIIFLWLTIFAIIFSVLISVLALKIDIKEINNFFNHGFKTNKLFFLFLFSMMVYPIFVGFWRFFVIYLRLKKENIHAKWYEWFAFVFIASFFNAITPFATGNESYTLFWLKSKGLDTKKALLILASTGIIYPLSQVLITWPSFFVISASYTSFSNDVLWTAGYWVAFVGLIFDLIAFFSYFTLVFNKRIHFILNRIFYWFRKKVRLSYKNKDEIKNKYLENATFRKEFLEEIKNYKFYTFVLIGSILSNFLYYNSMYFSYQLSSLDLGISYAEWFHYTNIATTANNWVPVAGSEGALQILIIIFINGINGVESTIQFQTHINNIVFIWRLFNFYLPAIIGMICFPISATVFYKKYKNL